LRSFRERTRPPEEAKRSGDVTTKEKMRYSDFKRGKQRKRLEKALLWKRSKKERNESGGAVPYRITALRNEIPQRRDQIILYKRFLPSSHSPISFTLAGLPTHSASKATFSVAKFSMNFDDAV
jgi:hypothetical protein